MSEKTWTDRCVAAIDAANTQVAQRGLILKSYRYNGEMTKRPHNELIGAPAITATIEAGLADGREAIEIYYGLANDGPEPSRKNLLMSASVGLRITIDQRATLSDDPVSSVLGSNLLAERMGNAAREAGQQ